MARTHLKAVAKSLALSSLALLPFKVLADEASLQHIAGYADAGYVDQRGEYGSFMLGHFNPIFHFLYRDLILADGELELEINSSGETEVNLEYGKLVFFVNDNIMFIAGKMLSPAGYFFQNLHPSWINKLPDHPPGFRDEEAAPEAFIGAELRGAVAFCPVKVTYSIFVANGPRGIVDGCEIEEIEGGGSNADIDGSKIVGGRIALLTGDHIEVGVSGAYGGIGLFDEDTDELIEKGRDYYLLGADAAIHYNNLELRGEIIQQKIDSSSKHHLKGGKWRGWYGQAAYKFLPTNFEGVIRYGEYHTPHHEDNYEQLAFGVDYWFAPYVVAKIAYEINSGDNEANTFFVQLAYGF